MKHYFVDADNIEDSSSAMDGFDAASLEEAIKKAKEYADDQCAFRKGEIVRWKLSEAGEDEDEILPIIASGFLISGNREEVNVNFDHANLGPALIEAHKTLAAIQAMLPKSRFRKFVRETANSIDAIKNFINAFDDDFFVPT